MKALFIILGLFLSFSCIGQKRNLHPEESTFWRDSRLEYCEKFSLDSIHKTQHKWYFRVWTKKQVIEIWKEANGKTSGKLTNWVGEHTSYDEEPTNRFYHKVKELDSIEVYQIDSLIQSSGIKNIPDDEKIEGWSHGFDGITYHIEYAIPKDYYFKSYWTPKAQDSLPEAIVVQSFINSVIDIVDGVHQWQLFEATIPFECYTNGGPRVICRALSNRDKRRMKRERKAYRKKEKEKKLSEAQNPNYDVALEFIDNYVNFLNDKDIETGLLEWIDRQPTLTDKFKSELNELINKADDQNPGIGLGFDPILDAQDYPEQGLKIEKTDSNFLILKGENWPDFKLIMKLKYQNKKWLVDGSGIVNIPENRRL